MIIDAKVFRVLRLFVSEDKTFIFFVFEAPDQDFVLEYNITAYTNPLEAGGPFNPAGGLGSALSFQAVSGSKPRPKMHFTEFSAQSAYGSNKFVFFYSQNLDSQRARK